MDQLKAPQKLDFNAADLPHTWKKMEGGVKFIFGLSNGRQKEKLKVKMFKYLIGGRGREVYNTLTFTEEEPNRTIEMVLGKFDAYCNPMKNETVERYKFNSRSQQSAETI